MAGDFNDDDREITIADGLALVRAQRNVVAPYKGRLIRAVGGLCQATTLTRQSVGTRVLERWPAY